MTASAPASADEAEAARRLLATYAAAVDTTDRDALAQVFAEDVVLHRVGIEDFHGRADVLAFYGGVFDGPVAWSSHLITNVVVDRVGGGWASTASFHAVSRTNDTVIDVYGRYRHRFAEVDGALVITEKWIDMQHRETRPYGAA